jgi:hypothetical protein
MQYIEGHIYKWNVSGEEQQGEYTGKRDTLIGFEGNLIMKNDFGVMWSISPQYIIEEVK